MARTAAVPIVLARVVALLGALALSLALLVAPGHAQVPEPAQEEVTPARAGGEDRWATAAAIATATYEQADVAVLATGMDHPDALAASYAAGSLGGPLLLVGSDLVPPATHEVLEQLGVETVVLVGGTGVIGDAVAGELEDEGYTVDRVSGVNRFQTASAVAMRYGTQVAVGTIDGDRTALLASGEAFPDALAAGPIAAAANLPLFLTPTGTTEVSVNTSLQQLDIERVVVVGGDAAVSSDVVRFYQDRGYEVERWAGPNRTATAATVADNAIARIDGFSAATVLLARGDDYPDALTASVHGAAIGAPILLTADPTVLSPATEGWLVDRCPEVEVVRAVGGTAAVSQQALGEAVSAAARCHGDGQEWTSCTNDVEGYTIDHPAAWATNETTIEQVPPCSLFDPDPAQIRTDGMHVPLDIAVTVFIDEVPFEDVAGPGPGDEVLAGPHATTVDGRAAERIETRTDGTAMPPEGTITTRWAVDLDGSTFIAVARSIGEPDYGVKAAVLDQMMETLTFHGAGDPVGLIGPASLEERDSGDMPRANATAYLTDVRTGVHDGFDRVVLELAGAERPGWQVTWAEPPITEDPSNQPVAVAGDAHLIVEMHRASALDVDLEPTYPGPDRIAVDGGVVTEVVQIGDHHGLLSWVIGLDGQAPFAVDLHHDPMRLIIDVVSG